jgi:hypothetical protein
MRRHERRPSGRRRGSARGSRPEHGRDLHRRRSRASGPLRRSRQTASPPCRPAARRSGRRAPPPRRPKVSQTGAAPFRVERRGQAFLVVEAARRLVVDGDLEFLAVRAHHEGRFRTARICGPFYHPAGDEGGAAVGDPLRHRRGGGDKAQVLRAQRRAGKAVGIFLGDEGGGDTRRSRKRGWSITADRNGRLWPMPSTSKASSDSAIASTASSRARRPGAQLGDHRIVEHRDLAALVDAGVVAAR